MVRYRDKRGRKQLGFVCAMSENVALKDAVRLYGMAIITIFPKV